MGTQWPMLAQGYPNDKMVHKRFQQESQSEVVRNVLIV